MELFGLKKLKQSYSKLSRKELLVRPPLSIDVFSMLGPSRLKFFTTGGVHQ